MPDMKALTTGATARGLFLCLAAVAAGVLATIALSQRAGPEDQALALARKQRASGDKAAALATLLSCGVRDRRACRCADEAEELALDLSHLAEALPVVERARCGDSARHAGVQAEALVAMGRADEGLRQAAAALARDANEPHASFAKAWALSTSGPSPEAVAAAQKAVDGGRGVPALLLLGMLRFRSGDSKHARDAIEQAARLAPTDSLVAYDLGVVTQGEGHYREAREAYLRALAHDPKLADARYNLALLTHSIGADDEARHHLDELAAIAPNDPRLPALRVTLGK